MATLTESSIYARRGLRYSIYAIIAFVIMRFIFISTISLYKTLFPAPPPAPTVTFGKLPKLPFPNANKIPLKFTLETADGQLPMFDTQTKVFFMPKLSANLLSLDFSKEKSQRLGFLQEGSQISDSLYRFNHKSAPSTLEINIINGSFSISYDFNIDNEPLANRPPLPEVAGQTVKTYLSGASLLPKDLSENNQYRYLKTQSGNFIPALSVSDGNVVRVDMFRKNIDEKPVVTNSPKDANVWFMLSGLRERGRDIVAGEYHYFPVDETQASTYPIKSSQMAWEEFNQGNYYPASIGAAVENDNIKIRKVYLAYYDPGVYVDFMQPVYVFEGDKDFVAYVPAVTNDYYGEKE